MRGEVNLRGVDPQLDYLSGCNHTCVFAPQKLIPGLEWYLRWNYGIYRGQKLQQKAANCTQHWQWWWPPKHFLFSEIFC
jgi:hypothetical protein